MASAQIGGFPRLLPPQVAIALDVHRQFQSFERFSSGTQRNLCSSQLHRLMRHARLHSLFWRDRLAEPAETEAGGDLNLSYLPVLTRK